MANIVIDPVTRIEGHLRMETEVSGGYVSNAWSTGTLLRGLETILQGRDPRDAWMMTQRICGVCTYVHGIASIKCVENTINLTMMESVRTARNVLMAAQYIHDHIVHFYHLSLLDWVDVASALNAYAANPTETANAAAAADIEMRTAGRRTASYFTTIGEKLKTFAIKADGSFGQLGPFANGYWGHPAYKLTPAQNLVLLADYLEALSVQNEIAKIIGIIAGKNPHPQSMLIGGFTYIYEAHLNSSIGYLNTAINFVDRYYLPDVKFLAKTYKSFDCADSGGFGNLLCVGEFPQDSSGNNLFPAGIIRNRNHNSILDVNVSSITEDVTRSWYIGDSNLHPSAGVTDPEYSGLKTSGKYSWIKAPRYNNEPMEVGPLARVIVAYGNNVAVVKDQVDSLLISAGLTFSQMYSTIGRIAARAIETKVLADVMLNWMNECKAWVHYQGSRSSFTFPLSGNGFSLSEAPRGALGHWINYNNGLTVNYQIVVPSTWNLGPRDASNVPGPVEQALVGTPVADQSKPLEILRVIHSYDPCIACAVHVLDVTGKVKPGIVVR